MTFRLHRRRPCIECPFRREVAYDRSRLNTDALVELVIDGDHSCHLSRLRKRRDDRKEVTCAGGLIFLSNAIRGGDTRYVPDNFEVARQLRIIDPLPEVSALVFDGPTSFRKACR